MRKRNGLRLLASAALAMVGFLTLGRGEAAVTTIETGLKQPNHLAIDDASIYWTEIGGSRVFLRKAAKTGGAVTTLYSEPAKDNRSLRVRYLQIQLAGGRVYWSRVATGFSEHYSILSIPADGGTVRTELPRDISVAPMLSSAWQVRGNSLYVVLVYPRDLGLPRSSRIGRLDTVNRTWSEFVGNRYGVASVALLTTDDQFVYVRGKLETDETEIASVPLEGGPGDLVTLQTDSEVDRNYTEPGTTDGVSLFHWSQFAGGPHRIRRTPIVGGAPTTVVSTGIGAGLTHAGGNLYFVSKSALRRVSAAGGQVTTLSTKVFGSAALGGIPIDATQAYVVQRLASGKFRIVAVPR